MGALRNPDISKGERRWRILSSASAPHLEQPEVTERVAWREGNNSALDALRVLVERDPRKAQIVELRFFGGLNLEEIAEVIGVAPITVSREWAKARAWLHREVAAEPRDRPPRH